MLHISQAVHIYKSAAVTRAGSEERMKAFETHPGIGSIKLLPKRAISAQCSEKNVIIF